MNAHKLQEILYLYELFIKERLLVNFLYHSSFFQMAEYRISVYGRKQSEWDQLASWFVNNEIYSENAVWLIQVSKYFLLYLFLFFLFLFCCVSGQLFVCPADLVLLMALFLLRWAHIIRYSLRLCVVGISLINMHLFYMTSQGLVIIKICSYHGCTISTKRWELSPLSRIF